MDTADEYTEYAAIVDGLANIREAYFSAQREDCRTQGLSANFTPDQRRAWRNYLFDYSNAMTGCRLIYPPIVEGGIGVFGPGNTPYTGAARPALGRDDVQLLTEKYVAAFGDVLGLTEAERSAVSTYLLRLGESEITASVSSALSTCSPPSGSTK